jgi:HEAT repeat protein
MKRDPAEPALERLEAIRHEPDSPVVLAVLRKGLASARNRVAARAARLAGERAAAELIPDLEDAFERFLRNPVKSDPGCLAKQTIVEVLADLGHAGEELYLRGARHVQLEPAWGPPVDTAADLRGLCGMALVQTGYPEAHFVLVDLLHDPEVQTRRHAVRGLTAFESQASELLLRMKARTGDPEPDVVGLCLAGLMAMAPDRSLPFLGEFLDGDDPALREEAALALGESRHPKAFPRLKACWDRNVDSDARQALALPIALCRGEESLAFLLGMVEEGAPTLAEAAVTALRIYRGDRERVERIRDAVDNRADRELARAYRDAFAEDSD